MEMRTVVIRLELPGWPVKDGEGQQVPLAIVRKQYRWVGTDADLVELIYALKGCRKIVVEGQPAEIKDVAELFEHWFGKKLANVYWTGMVNQKSGKRTGAV